MQFRLSTLLLLFVVLWSSLAIFGAMYGAINCVMVVALAICLARGPLPKSLGWFLLLLEAYFLLAVFLTPPKAAATSARSQDCCDNLKQIALALHNYQRAKGCFPPAYVADKNGRPMHSWRVLILPYLDDDSAAELYKQYKFNEPWDGPNNGKLLTRRPKRYVCPSASDPTGTCTNYVAATGRDAAWSGERAKRITDLAPTESTIMLVETATTRIPWMAPQDVNLDFPLDSPSPGTVSSRHKSRTESADYPMRTGAFVAMADGHVTYLTGKELDSNKASILFRIGGCREKNYLDRRPATAVQRRPWADCMALTVWLASVGLLLFRAVRSRKKLAAKAVAERAGQGTAIESGQTRMNQEQ